MTQKKSSSLMTQYVQLSSILSEVLLIYLLVIALTIKVILNPSDFQKVMKYALFYSFLIVIKISL